MSSLRGCCEVCFSPNTVSKFVRIFPRAALFFIVLHVGIMIYSLSSGMKKDAVKAEPGNILPVEKYESLGENMDDKVHIRKFPALHNNTKEMKGKRRKKRRIQGDIDVEKLKAVEKL